MRENENKSVPQDLCRTFLRFFIDNCGFSETLAVFTSGFHALSRAIKSFPFFLASASATMLRPRPLETRGMLVSATNGTEGKELLR